MAASKPMSQNRRLLLWSVLGFALVASIALLARACSDDEAQAEFPPNSVLRLVGEGGELIRDAEPLILKPLDRKDAPMRSRWNPRTATLELPVLPLETRLLVVARGYRMARVDDLGTSRDVVMQKGIPIRLRLRGDAPAMDPPLVGLFRIRPTSETMEVREAKTTGVTIDLSELMVSIHPSRTDALELPRKRWGFASSEEDASIGLRVPRPGRYIVRWGILDERPGTWWTPKDGPELEIEVKDLVTPQTFDVEVTRDDWNRTREGLRKTIAEMQAGG